MKELKGKVAVVTGGASGIGRALADAFAARGMNLCLTDVEAEPLQRAAAELEQSGIEVMTKHFDVSDRDAVGRLADEVWERFGAAHILCNNAGVGRGGPMTQLTLPDWDWVLQVNLFGVIYGIQAFLNRMIESGEPCHIVNTASIAGLIAIGNMGPYNASKSAVVAISETLNAEMQTAGHDVGVTVVCPAWVKTRIHESDRNAGDRQGLSEETPEKQAMLEEIGQLIDTGIDPAGVAQRVLEAIENKNLYVLTHPEFMEMVESRFQTILAAGPS